MIIKEGTPSLNKTVNGRTSQKIWNIFSCLIIFINVLIITGILLYTKINPTASDAAWNKINKTFQITKSIKTYPKAIIHAIQGSFKKSEHITIDISHINMQKLEYMRRQAIPVISGEQEFDYVSVKITEGNKQLKAKIKLKGDRKIHYESLSNASFRVKIKGDNTLYGMKTFSLHKPRSRNYIYEWIFLQLVKAEGLIAPNYFFINLSMNGKNLGVYALEEHYDKYLIERYRLKDGPIIRFDESTRGGNGYADMQVAPYDEKKWIKPEFSSVASKAINLLEGYKSDQLSVNEVFDIKKLAMFYAITDIMGTHHGAVPKSVRYYYNPITSLLEPIAFDGHNFFDREKPIFAYERGITPKNFIYKFWREYFYKLFNTPKKVDREFIREYILALEKLSAPNYLENFFLSIDDELKNNLGLIYSEFPLEDHVFSFGPAPFIFDETILIQKRDYASRHLNKARIKAYLNKIHDDRLEVHIEVIDNRLPIEILDLSCGDYVFPALENHTLLVSPVEITKQITHSISFVYNAEQINLKDFPACLSLVYRRPGLTTSHSEQVFPWKKHEDSTSIKGDIMRQKGNYESFKSIQRTSQNVLTIPEGRHIINKNIVIPKGYTLEARPGAEIFLNNHAILLSRSPIRFIGTENNPVLISTTDDTGQGIIVLQSDTESELEHVIIDSLSHPAQNNWSLTGTVTFYESPLKLENVKFVNNQSEDALNIIRSKFSLSNLNFTDAKADALDIDFGTGSINGAVFENIGNDAIDISGTAITMHHIEMNSVADKGISAGEASIVNGSDIEVRNTELAVTSKDNSIINLSRVHVTESSVALIAFQKKTEFGPAQINIKNFTSDGKGKTSLIEYGSALNLNETIIVGDQFNVEKILYGVTYGTSSN